MNGCAAAEPKLIDRSRLGPLGFIAKGNFGEVFKVNGFTLPGDHSPLAYKKFTLDHATQASLARDSVAFREALSLPERSELDRYSAWPRALVADSTGNICGLLMPLIPGEFFCQAMEAETGRLASRVREMQWLITTNAQRQEAQVDLGLIESLDRMLLLAQLVYIVGWLHKRGWVFGDLSFKNVAFALAPPRIMLMDCDGAAALANQGRRQPSTPMWDPPECPISPPRQQDQQDERTDCYKLGLAILRCLSPGRGASSSRNSARLQAELDAEGIDLVARAIESDRQARPTAKELYAYLRAVIAPDIDPPEIIHARLVTGLCIRGHDSMIEWQISGATDISVAIGSQAVLRTDPRHHPDGCAITPAKSGPVTIEACNRFGRATVDLGLLSLFDLPPFELSLGSLPRPSVDFPGAFRFPAFAAAALGDRPRVTVGQHGLPRVTLPTVFDLVDGMVPVQREALVWPPVSDIVHEAAASITNGIQHEGAEFMSRLREIFIRETESTGLGWP
jgi:hypothetical protein